MLYGLVGDIDFFNIYPWTSTFRTVQFMRLITPYYQQEKGFYWQCRRSGCVDEKMHRIHFSFLPHYRNYGNNDYGLDQQSCAVCPRDVRMFLVLTKCKKAWDKHPKYCDQSELLEPNKISLDDIGESQSGIVNGAIYHQIYCVPEFTHAIPVKHVLVS